MPSSRLPNDVEGVLSKPDLRVSIEVSVGVVVFVSPQDKRMGRKTEIISARKLCARPKNIQKGR